MPGVTISSGYGAGGSVVARDLAARLGYPLLDRAISSRIAEKLHVSLEEAEDGRVKRSIAERFFGVLAPMAGGVVGIDVDGTPGAPLPMDDATEFRENAEVIMRQALVSGVVILGRAGAAALRDEPGVLRARLFGQRDARIAHAMRAEGVDEETATRRLPQVDTARAQYVRRLYGRDIDDPDLYHLQIDSTVVPASGCVAAIAAAYESLGTAD